MWQSPQASFSLKCLSNVEECSRRKNRVCPQEPGSQRSRVFSAAILVNFVNTPFGNRQDYAVTDLNPQSKQMADESMVRGLDAQARAIWPQEVQLIRRYALPGETRILD